MSGHFSTPHEMEGPDRTLTGIESFPITTGAQMSDPLLASHPSLWSHHHPMQDVKSFSHDHIYSVDSTSSPLSDTMDKGMRPGADPLLHSELHDVVLDSPVQYPFQSLDCLFPHQMSTSDQFPDYEDLTSGCLLDQDTVTGLVDQESLLNEETSEGSDQEYMPSKPKSSRRAPPSSERVTLAFQRMEQTVEKLNVKKKKEHISHRGKKAPTALALSQDLEESEEVHVCPVPQCKRAFKRLEHLMRHFRMHSGEKPYKCSQCEKSFTRSDNLAAHIARIHDPTQAAGKKKLRISTQSLDHVDSPSISPTLAAASGVSHKSRCKSRPKSTRQDSISSTASEPCKSSFTLAAADLNRSLNSALFPTPPASPAPPQSAEPLKRLSHGPSHQRPTHHRSTSLPEAGSIITGEDAIVDAILAHSRREMARQSSPQQPFHDHILGARNVTGLHRLIIASQDPSPMSPMSELSPLSPEPMMYPSVEMMGNKTPTDSRRSSAEYSPSTFLPTDAIPTCITPTELVNSSPFDSPVYPAVDNTSAFQHVHNFYSYYYHSMH